MTTMLELMHQPRQDERPGKDGLLYCVKCGTPRQKRLAFLGENHLVRCVCHCQAKATQEAEDARKAAELRDQIARYRDLGITDAALRQATFENDRLGGPEMDLAKRYVNQWQEMRRQALGLVLWGGVGTGKTYLAACIANALLDKAVPVMMTSFGRILGGMPSAATGEQNRYIDGFNSYDLLIIDDLGAERQTDYACAQVYNVIDARYRTHLPLIVTTNLKLSQLKEPDTLAKQRIYGRVLERCVPLCINRRKIRREQTDSNTQLAQKLLNG